MTLVNHLVVFANPPRVGRAKTRLARDIGPVGAWAFHRLMLARAVRAFGNDARWRCWLAVTADPGFAGVGPLDGIGLIAQGGGDLGRRMARVARALPPGPVVIVGTDSPGVTPGHAATAFRALGAADAVFGPAVDGGYWLVGLKRRPRFIDPFRNVRWSSAMALADTLANLGGRRWVLLEVLEDVDDGASYARWRRGVRS